MASNRRSLEADYESSSEDIRTADMESYRSQLETDYELSSESYRSSLHSDYELSSEDISTADMESYRSPLETCYELSSESYRSSLHSDYELSSEESPLESGNRSRAQSQDMRHPGIRMSSPFEQEHNMIEIQRHDVRPAQSQGVLHPGVRMSSPFQPEHNRKKIQRHGVRPAQSQGVRHPGVTCDGCGVNIRGIRYKCKACKNYDLCSACKKKGFHREHSMLPIEKPQQKSDQDMRSLLSPLFQHESTMSEKSQPARPAQSHQARGQDMGFLSPTLHLEEALQQLCSLAPSNPTASLHDQKRKVSSEKATPCRLCVQRNKGAVLVPCGHALCTVCAGAIMKSAKTKCPFCRKKIFGYSS